MKRSTTIRVGMLACLLIELGLGRAVLAFVG